jgi:hypothetical protein
MEEGTYPVCKFCEIKKALVDAVEAQEPEVTLDTIGVSFLLSFVEEARADEVNIDRMSFIVGLMDAWAERGAGHSMLH